MYFAVRIQLRNTDGWVAQMSVNVQYPEHVVVGDYPSEVIRLGTCTYRRIAHVPEFAF